MTKVAFMFPGQGSLEEGMGREIAESVPEAMEVFRDGSDAAGIDQGYGMALMNVAWAPGQVVGAAAGGAVAQAIGDAVPYVVGAVLCVLTLAVLRGASLEGRWRFASSS
jgi:predicted MFS family arabinose efflux permease